MCHRMYISIIYKYMSSSVQFWWSTDCDQLRVTLCKTVIRFALKVFAEISWIKMMQADALNRYHCAMFIKGTWNSLTNLLRLQIKFNIIWILSRLSIVRARAHTLICVCNVHFAKRIAWTTDGLCVCTWHWKLHFAFWILYYVLNIFQWELSFWVVPLYLHLSLSLSHRISLR